MNTHRKWNAWNKISWYCLCEVRFSIYIPELVVRLHHTQTHTHSLTQGRCLCTCRVICATVDTGVIFQFGGELLPQLMKGLLSYRILHIHCELNLLCQTQNLKPESLHIHFNWSTFTSTDPQRPLSDSNESVCVLPGKGSGWDPHFLSVPLSHTHTEDVSECFSSLRREHSAKPYTHTQ